MLTGEDYDEAQEAARAWAAEHAGVFNSPFDHPDIIAGQGTLGLDIVDGVPDVGTVVVPVGGGGLIAGVAAAVKARRPEARVIGIAPHDPACKRAARCRRRQRADGCPAKIRAAGR